MIAIKIKEDVIPSIDQLSYLYENVDWMLYTRELDLFKKALKNSLKVWTVWHNGKLVGLSRVVGDNHTIVYIEDILVSKDYQDRKIGIELLQIILDFFASVKEIIMITENAKKTNKYYEKKGLQITRNFKVISCSKK